MTKQSNYNAGIYVRLSQEDERAGESLSIENQKLILTKYVAEQDWTLVDVYVDDGYSGTDFNRPAVTQLLEDAKNGKINLIICKDLSRFGRNYIEVGQYVDYIFPTYNIRFIALNDNVDTANQNSAAMDMMPIVNIFNEWHCSNTSRKIKAVKEASAKSGKYSTTFAPYGYVKGDNDKHLPVIDPEAAEVVKRIFTMRSTGISPRHIADTLNAEHVLIPSDYIYGKMGKPNPRRTQHLWSADTVRQLLKNPIYLGDLVQMKTTTVSYKVHKSVKKAEEDWVVIPNTHEPIISRELWDKVREMEASVAQGKKTKSGIVMPLSGFMYCADCGEKMRLLYNNTTWGSKKKPLRYIRHNYNCGTYNRFGKIACNSHYIKMKDIDAIVLADIRALTQQVIEDESAAKSAFLAKKQSEHAKQTSEDKKRLSDSKHRLNELANLIPKIYEDKVLGKVPEDVCLDLLQKYTAEQKELNAVVADLEAKQQESRKDEEDVEKFVSRLKKYAGAGELTREMCMELIEYIVVDEYAADRPRHIEIYYKFLDKALENKNHLNLPQSA